MNREAALQIVHQYVRSETLIRHMLAVEAAMRFYAQKLGQDVEDWGQCGLLHDYDWEIHPNATQHPLAGLDLLRQNGLSEEILHAIASHADHTGIARTSLMDKGLFACDELCGLVTAVALVRPSKSLYDLEVSSVKKKWKDKTFAAGADRVLIQKGAEDFDLDLWEHTANIISALQVIAPALGLAGVG